MGRKQLGYFCIYICYNLEIYLCVATTKAGTYLGGRDTNCKRIQEIYLRNTHLFLILHCSDHASCLTPGLISLRAKQASSPLHVRETSGFGASCLRNISTGVPPFLSPVPVFLKNDSLKLQYHTETSQSELFQICLLPLDLCTLQLIYLYFYLCFRYNCFVHFGFHYQCLLSCFLVTTSKHNTSMNDSPC